MELSLGGSFGGLSLLADLGDRIPDDRRPCQHLNRHVQQNWVILLVMKASIIRRALVWYVRIFKIKLNIAFFKFSAAFQILCNISNSLHHFKFASWLWILCSLAGLVTDGQNEYCEKWWRWVVEIEKVEKSESWVFPPWAPWSWRPWTTRPSHTVRILSIGYNYNIFFVFSITSIIICWNELSVRKMRGLQYIGAGLQYIGAPEFYFQNSGKDWGGRALIKPGFVYHMMAQLMNWKHFVCRVSCSKIKQKHVCWTEGAPI